MKIVNISDQRGKQAEARTKRLFFAVNLPHAVTSRLDNLSATFGVPAGHVRWVRGENMHITLKFLGDVEDSAIPKLCDAARKAVDGFSPMRIAVEGMGVFPNHEKPKVVWFGVTGETEPMKKLESALSEELSKLGYPPDERSFTPHLTIGRVKNDIARGKLARLVRQYHKFYIGEAVVSEIALYESRLSPKGSIYSPVDTFHLSGGEE